MTLLPLRAGAGGSGGAPDDDGGPDDAGSGGDCSGSCENPHGTAECIADSCLLTCATGYADCDSAPGNGCETSTQDQLASCGSCGRSCGNAHGTTACSAGACLPECTSGFSDCDGDASNGCETSLNSLDHCGACGEVCVNDHGATRCGGGTCSPTCAPGYDDCDGQPDNGCEAALDSASDCGACGNVCPENGGTASCSAGTCSSVCKLDGTYALKLTIPATWPGSAALSTGNGDFTLWGKLQATQSGTSLSGALSLCGQSIPDFDAAPAINEHYGLNYPGALFDRTPPLPSTLVSGTLGGTAPGSTFALARSALLMGASMADPINGAWPSAAAIMSVDSDADGKPGLSSPYKSGAGYDAPPANNFGTARGVTAYMTTRVVFSLSGTLTSCTESSGAATAQDIDSHTLGCRITGGSRDCSPSEADHLDSNAPNYQTGAATYRLVKLSDDATCPDVRSALP